MRFLPLLFLTLTLQAQNSLNNQRPIVMATCQYADNPRIKNLEPFASHFTEVNGIKAIVKSYPTVYALLEAMKKQEVDVVFINTFGYLLSREVTDAYELSAALFVRKETAAAYRSVIVTPNVNHTPTLTYAVDRASDNYLLLVSAGSTSGNLIPRLKLASMLPDDPEKFFVEVQYAERHDAALRLALEEKFAIVSCAMDEYHKLGADTAKFTLLWKSEPIPLGPVVVRKGLSQNIRSSLQNAFLELRDQNPDALEAIKAGWTEAKDAEHFTVVDETYYNSLIELAGDKQKAMRIIKKFVR